MSSLVPILYNAGWWRSKMSNLIQIFNVTKISSLSLTSYFTGPWWSEIWKLLSVKFSSPLKFLHWPNIKFLRSAVVNLKFESNFQQQHDSNIFIRPNFKFRRSAWLQTILWLRLNKLLTHVTNIGGLLWHIYQKQNHTRKGNLYTL